MLGSPKNPTHDYLPTLYLPTREQRIKVVIADDDNEVVRAGTCMVHLASRYLIF